jgi:hypothetical protein
VTRAQRKPLSERAHLLAELARSRRQAEASAQRALEMEAERDDAREYARRLETVLALYPYVRPKARPVIPRPRVATK